MKKSLSLFALLFSFQSFAYLSVMPFSADFGTVYEGGYTSPQSIRITNLGDEDVTLNIYDTCFYEFRIRDSFCNYLVRGGSCRIDIDFSPRREGFYSCAINVQSSNSDYQRIGIRARVMRR